MRPALKNALKNQLSQLVILGAASKDEESEIITMIELKETNEIGTKKELMTKKELSLYLKCCEKTIERMVKTNKIKPIKFQSCLRYDLDDILNKFRKDK